MNAIKQDMNAIKQNTDRLTLACNNRFLYGNTKNMNCVDGMVICKNGRAEKKLYPNIQKPGDDEKIYCNFVKKKKNSGINKLPSTKHGRNNVLLPQKYQQEISVKKAQQDRINLNNMFTGSANCSFVTSYALSNKEEPYGGPGSDNFYVFMKALEKARLSETFEKLTFEHIWNTKNIESLFRDTITKIQSKIREAQNSSSYCVVGLQELNDTKNVHKICESGESDNEFKLLCNSMSDKIVGTMPTLGFLMTSDFFNENEPLFLKTNKEHRLFKVENEVIENKVEYKSSFVENDSKERHHSVETGLNKYVAIRDLGMVSQVGGEYLFKKNTNPDAGRPIAILVKKSATDDHIDVIHMNCHMPNPSVLKLGNKDGPHDDYKDNSILQRNWSTNKETWVSYCRHVMKSTIGEILSNDYENLTDRITDDTVWILNGDLNDVDGALMESLQKIPLKINVNGPIKKACFIFPSNYKALYTACPNTNSTKVNIDVNGETEESKDNHEEQFTDAIKREAFGYNAKTYKELFDNYKPSNTDTGKSFLDKRFYYLLKHFEQEKDWKGTEMDTENQALFLGDTYSKASVSLWDWFIKGKQQHNLFKAAKLDILSDHIGVTDENNTQSAGKRRSRRTRKNRRTRKKTARKYKKKARSARRNRRRVSRKS